MSDIAIKIDKFGDGDMQVANGDLLGDDGLETAVIISLFTDRRVTREELPYGETDRRGYWGDIVTRVQGDQTGSKLWTLQRAKETPETLAKARAYCREALAWMIDDGVTDRIEVETEFLGPGVMGIGITIHQPAGVQSLQYEYAWQAQEAKIAA